MQCVSAVCIPMRYVYIAREKLSSEEIQQQMKELGVEMEIVPLI